ncbi:uncharacterized protein LOC113509815 [Galleria mellonella]|uniref:protein-tyrosine-phosphatase n=1 Tax=Galleria mellonella TaxID=7137 RepID=A0ABM3MTV1_GALME|nr:uncharacterized protein LOC113509815 [Galleria mellonella]
MPFKLKLKKTRQYNVASKSLFVISVELLDGGVADCTLSVDSSGSECLDNVCQRQSIQQSQFFGLRYLNRNCQPRWVQLERPLKRQLDKYASTHQLYLRVMYYIISGTSLINDEVTRYHYFLQLKNDLVEGRISCDCQQAVVLASYSRQAEYGNHDRERHTVEYLKNLLTFPKQIHDGNQIIDLSNRPEPGVLERLTSAVIQHHMTLHNMSQAQAEEGFITTCQQLPGYGQETFSARDERNQKEVTLAISITGIRVITDSSDTTKYYRWMDITNVINHKRTFSIECQKAESASFTLWSPEDGKYVWRMCIQQHTFYMQHQGALGEHQQVTHEEHRPKFQDHGLSDSREELDVRDGGSVSRLEPLTAAHRAHSTSCLELADQQRPQLLHRNRALLPSYRPAPDYETAIQQKYQQQRTDAQLRYQNHPHSQVNINAKPLVYGSHPDIHRIHYPDVTRHTVSVNQGVSPSEEYPYGIKLMGNYPFAINPNVQTERNPQLHYVNVYKPPPPYPSNGLASNSTPDLAVASQALNYHRGYINSHVSGSSPDLVSTRTALNRQYLGYLNTGSHNVVNYGRPNLIPPTHGTYNNLASVLEPNPHIIIDPHHISDNIQKVYDERGNIMYSMPLHRLPYQRHLVMPQQVGKVSDTQEPIYENVPLPWRNEHGKITFRDRAQSLTTTDEIARLNERNSSHPTINSYGVPQPNLTVSNYPHVPIKIENPDSHYVNAQVIKGVRESSLPKDLNASSRSINKPDSELENIALSAERLSLRHDEKEYDETPYTSLSTHKVSNNNTISRTADNVTSVSVADHNANLSRASGADSALSSSIMNSTYSTSIELDSSNTKNASVSSKEKKRRRWGVFMGRAAKTTEVKSATLGRDRAKPSAGQPHNKHRWSTGLPKFQPLPPSITKETLCQLLERKMSDEQLSFAFEQIPKGRENGGECRAALESGGRGERLPYDDNRVRLHPTAANPHGYINASHITMTVGSTQQFYVVAKVGAEGPSGGTEGLAESALVWECAWQVGARLLALVGPAAPRYLPPAAAPALYGQVQHAARSTQHAARSTDHHSHAGVGVRVAGGRAAAGARGARRAPLPAARRRARPLRTGTARSTQHAAQTTTRTLVWECAWQVGARLLALVGPAAPRYLPPAAAPALYGQVQHAARSTQHAARSTDHHSHAGVGVRVAGGRAAAGARGARRAPLPAARRRARPLRTGTARSTQHAARSTQHRPPLARWCGSARGRWARGCWRSWGPPRPATCRPPPRPPSTDRYSTQHAARSTQHAAQTTTRTLVWECAWQVGARLLALVGPAAPRYLPPAAAPALYGQVQHAARSTQHAARSTDHHSHAGVGVRVAGGRAAAGARGARRAPLPAARRRARPLRTGTARSTQHAARSTQHRPPLARWCGSARGRWARGCWRSWGPPRPATCRPPPRPPSTDRYSTQHAARSTQHAAQTTTRTLVWECAWQVGARLLALVGPAAPRYLPPAAAPALYGQVQHAARSTQHAARSTDHHSHAGVGVRVAGGRAAAGARGARRAPLPAARRRARPLRTGTARSTQHAARSTQHRPPLARWCGSARGRWARGCWRSWGPPRPATCRPPPRPPSTDRYSTQHAARSTQHAAQTTTRTLVWECAWQVGARLLALVGPAAPRYLPPAAAPALYGQVQHAARSTQHAARSTDHHSHAGVGVRVAGGRAAAGARGARRAPLPAARRRARPLRTGTARSTQHAARSTQHRPPLARWCGSARGRWARGCWRSWGPPRPATCRPPPRPPSTDRYSTQHAARSTQHAAQTTTRTLVWECAWQVGARLLALVGPAAPRYLPPAAAPALYGQVQHAARSTQHRPPLARWCGSARGRWARGCWRSWGPPRPATCRPPPRPPSTDRYSTQHAARSTQHAAQTTTRTLVWECAWQVGARLLALVGPAAPRYLPPAAAPALYGQFHVCTGRESLAAWGSSVRVRVRRGGAGAAGRTRHLWHVHFRAWHSPHHAPDVDHFLEFISELNSLRLASEEEAQAERSPVASRNAPLAFVCARGAGRSGTALAAHLLLHVLDNNQELDIPRTIGLLHQQRANLIENVQQYKFIHQVLLQYLKQSRLI